MASMQPRAASQRRPTSEQAVNESSSTSPHRARSQSQARSASSEDSQTVLLNTSSILRDQETSEPQAGSTSTLGAGAQSGPARHQDEFDGKKCWICFSDESEDGPETSDWRDPCPCALVAHEDCLLDWIADMESPSSRKRTLGPPKIVCPQCKSEIHLARPRNYIVEAVRALERAAAKAVLPASVLAAMSTIVTAFTVHGAYSIHAVFGGPDAYRILQPLLRPRELLGAGLHARLAWLLQHWRLRLGLPLITPTLILSRTSLSDNILPILPMIFFATQGAAGDLDEPLQFASWPPSASLTFAVLPYLKGLYSVYYDRVWAEKEKRWLKDIQPRARDNDQANAGDDQDDLGDADPNVVNADNNFEIRVDAGIWEEWAGDDDAPAPQPQAAHPLNAPPLADGGEQQQQQQQQQQPQQQPVAGGAQAQAQAQAQNANNAHAHAHNHQERLLSFSTTAIAEKVLGALLFPTIASAAGNALRFLLPRSWTSKPLYGGRATGLLQEKWGRSVVGGCLFVVFKDALMLYVRWKMAQQHRRRRVLDYDRKAKKLR